MPTLLNWQLRHLPVWEELTDVHEGVVAYWKSDEPGAMDVNKLSWAVVVGSSGRVQAARLFPRIDIRRKELQKRDQIISLALK